MLIFFLSSNKHNPRPTTHDPRPAHPRPTYPRDLASPQIKQATDTEMTIVQDGEGKKSPEI